MHSGRELNGGSSSFPEVMSRQLCSLLERLDNRIGIETPAFAVFHIGDADDSSTINRKGLRSIALGCLAPLLSNSSPYTEVDLPTYLNDPYHVSISLMGKGDHYGAETSSITSAPRSLS
jgi:hypothetical protein